MRGGAAEGLDTLFITGGLAAGEFGGTLPPDTTLLSDWLARHGANPVLSIPALA